MRRDYLQHSHSWVIRDIQSAFQHFEPQKIRRVYIDKPGKAEKRPLGIPTIWDRIVQECMRIVLDPIMEAQFFEFKMVRGKSRRGYISRTIPDRDRLKRKVYEIAENIKKIPRHYSKEQLVGEIHRINSKIRGLIQYYQCCTWVSVSMKKYSHWLQLLARKRLEQYKGKWIPANKVQNLPRVHEQYKQKISSVKYRDMYVGFTAFTFCKWEKTPQKNQSETPYTEEGRQANFKRTKKKRIQARLDEAFTEEAFQAAGKKWARFNNFEFILNRAYALNRDKLKCRVCGRWLISHIPYTHRINPNLPLDKVNRVNNLVSVHKKCFEAIHNPGVDISEFDGKEQKKKLSVIGKSWFLHIRATINLY